jgi:DUF4097 and DUF4098 domain-containing protein YvlB
MAASPPPYTPPLSPDEQQRRQKEYWRAQKEASRSQRDYLRSQRRDQQYYWKSMHRPSIVGPVLLLAIGVIALLIETGRLSSSFFWDWFLRWWPILLVFLGLVSLLEWFLDRDQPYRRKTGGFGIVLLIAILVGIGYAHGHLSRFAQQVGADDDDGWSSLMGQEHDKDADSSVSIPANASVQVLNSHGDVTITGSSDNQVHVHAHQIVHSNSDGETRRVFAALDPHIQVNGTSVVVRVEGRNNGRADLTIELPESASSDITSGRGDVTIEGLKGASNVTASRGDVKLTGLGGNVHVQMSKGDFSAHGVGGNLTLDGHVGDVTVSEVSGSLTMDGDFFGDIHLEQVASAVRFHSSRTDLQVARLAGDLTMDDDDLHVGQSVGPLRIVTRSKNIECSQVSGDVHIENSNGEVSVTAVQPLGDIQITNASDPVTLTLPPDANFTINASTNGGDLNTDFSLNVSGGDEHRNASGTIGAGGPRIDINVRHGDLSLKKGDTNMPPLPPLPHIPAIPKMPKVPSIPSGAEKHLRAPKDVRSEPNVL